MEKRAADAEVTEPWFDKDPELPDRKAYDEDYQEVLRCLGNRSDRRRAVAKLRTGHSLKIRNLHGQEEGPCLQSFQEIRNLHCWLAGEEVIIKKGDDKKHRFCPHRWEEAVPKKQKFPLQGWLPRDVDEVHRLPLGALAHAVLCGCESNVTATTKELKAVSDDWARGLSLGSIKKAWWQTMRLRRLRRKTTVPKYDVWSEIRKLGLEEMKYEAWSEIRKRPGFFSTAAASGA